jgi:MFS family permease
MSYRPKVFYGWWVIAACSLGLFLSTGPVVVLSFGVFLKSLIQDFHAGRGAVSFAFTLHNLTGAVCVPLAGRLIDRFGARRVILTGTAIFALILVSSELLGTRIAYLYFFYTALGLVSGSSSPVPYGAVASRWFDQRRGLALGLMMLGLGLGAITLPLIAHRLIVIFGWRTAYATFGCAALLICLPVMAALVKDDPKKKGLLPDGVVRAQGAEQGEHQLEGLSWHDIWHQPIFWLLISAFFLAGGSVHACALHMPALLTDRGASAEGGAVASSIVGVALLIGRVGTGYLLDRLLASRLATLFFGGASVGIALLWVGSAGKVALFAAFLIGLGMGAEGDIIAYSMSRYFGLRAFGTAYGYGFGAFVLAGAAGVFLMGAGFDSAHSYTVPLGIFFFAMLTAAGLMSRLGPYRYTARRAAPVLAAANAEATIQA